MTIYAAKTNSRHCFCIHLLIWLVFIGCWLLTVEFVPLTLNQLCLLAFCVWKTLCARSTWLVQPGNIYPQHFSLSRSFIFCIQSHNCDVPSLMPEAWLCSMALLQPSTNGPSCWHCIDLWESSHVQWTHVVILRWDEICNYQPVPDWGYELRHSCQHSRYCFKIPDVKSMFIIVTLTLIILWLFICGQFGCSSETYHRGCGSS